VFDWGDLITGNIERIEVLKGPQSIQWGADAKGGVINIITKKGKGKPQHAFTFEGGTFATFKESIQTSGSINNISYSIFGQHLYSDGFSSVNDQAPRGGGGGDGTINKTISTRLGYEFSKNTDMEFIGRYIKSNDEIDDSFNRVDSSASNNVDEFSVSLPFKTSFSGCGDCFFQMWDVKLIPSLYYKHALTIGVTTRSVSVDRTLTMDLQNNVSNILSLRMAQQKPL
jgi:vitamin B12 transporter